MDKLMEKLLQDYDRHCSRIEKATQIKLGETTGEKAVRMKMLEGDYIKWWEYYFPQYAKSKSAKFHKTLGDEIIKNPKIRMLAEMYRGAAKSCHINIGIPLFLMFVKQQLRFMLLVGSTDIKAKKLISDIQAELVKNAKLKHDYGNKFSLGDWSEGNFITTDGVRFMGIGFGTDPRGLREGADRPDYITVDDVDSKKHINNDRIMSESVDYIEEDIMGCFDSSDVGFESTERFVYSNNNFHKNSITNRLKIKYKAAIKRNKADGIKSDYHVLTVAAVTDLRTFTPTWPEKNKCCLLEKKIQ